MVVKTKSDRSVRLETEPFSDPKTSKKNWLVSEAERIGQISLKSVKTHQELVAKIDMNGQLLLCYFLF